MSSSVSNFSFHYHPEDEQLEDYDTPASISTSSVKSESPEEDSRLSRHGVKEDTDKWKLFREIGRITKSVEDKFEEIKTERLKNQKTKKCPLGQVDGSSVSDSEDPSEGMQAQPSVSEKVERMDDESDTLGSQNSSPERSTTPMPPSPDEEEDLFVLKKGKGLKNFLKRKKGKTREKDFEKIAFSELCDGSDTETIEMAQEVSEMSVEASDTTLARELDKLAHPTLARRVRMFVEDWHMVLFPLIAVSLQWFMVLPDYLMGFIVGVLAMLFLQKITTSFRSILGSTEAPFKQLKDLLPLTEIPIFRRSIYDSDVAETSFQGWMNEYNREYSPETYHITLTETVYVRLEGSRLRLSSPRCKVPKRALWNEPQYKLSFNRERLFDISRCKVELKPDGLIHRRCWSKKYPICINLSSGARLGVRYREKTEETVDEKGPWIEEDKYSFGAVSEDSDDEQTPLLPSTSENRHISDKNQEYTRLSMLSDMSLDSSISAYRPEDIEDSFVKITPASPQESLLYLFARTDREKELWFRRLVNASKSTSSPLQGRRSPTKKSDLNYLSFMLNLSQRTSAQIPIAKEKNSVNMADLSISMELMWVNAFAGRLLYDVFHDPSKLVKIQEKIQRKLSTIKLPIFLEQLEVTQLDLGSAIPIVQCATRPTLNSSGIWVDLELVYEGGFKMTVDTKVNLDRMKQAQAESPTSESPKSGSPAKSSSTSLPQLGEVSRKSAVYDSCVEDSAETSSEEPDMGRLASDASGAGGSAQHKYLRILDKVAQSKYFQQVVDYKFIKKLVSGNSLQLVVEVKGLLGTLVLNIPPPPSDRLWYGFRTNPKLWLSAYPKFGQHAFHVISRIIEKKLSLEFQRVLVLPNMDDLLIPIMSHDPPS